MPIFICIMLNNYFVCNDQKLFKNRCSTMQHRA